MTALEGELLKAVGDLNAHQQRQVLNYARALSSPARDSASINRGRSSADLLRFAGTIPPADLRETTAAIHEACEKVDPNNWYLLDTHIVR